MVIDVVSKSGRRGHDQVISAGRPWLSRSELRLALPAWLRGTLIGLPFGVIPAGGAEIPTFFAYGTERSIDGRRGRRMFVQGAIQGVAAPVPAASATAGTAIGPLAVPERRPGHGHLLFAQPAVLGLD